MSSRLPPTQTIPAGKIPPLYTVIRSRLPLSPSQILNLSLKPYVALDWMVRCSVCEDSALLVLQYVFLSEALCCAGHLAYAQEIVVRAQTRLAELYANATKSGQWQLDDDTYAALQSALSVYIAQLHIVSRADLQRAGLVIEEWKKNHRKAIAQT
ncbi:hypothetical protein [Paraburkholderia sp. RL17-337-BIB-A]|uniref:hypothetical protein n=1 Tax=Paraburkholderia sp. RL17-337-BIB-A TaxID=3031636 RepID=UPI0038BCCCAA